MLGETRLFCIFRCCQEISRCWLESRELIAELAERMSVTRESIAAERVRDPDRPGKHSPAGQFAAAKGAVEAKHDVPGLNPTTKIGERQYHHNIFSQTDGRRVALRACLYDQRESARPRASRLIALRYGRRKE